MSCQICLNAISAYYMPKKRYIDEHTPLMSSTELHSSYRFKHF